MTSVNSTEYRIERNGKEVGTHHQHWYCKTHWNDLLKYEPLHEHTITAYGEDENESPWEDPPKSLRLFLIEQGVVERTKNDPPEFIYPYLNTEKQKVRWCCNGNVERIASIVESAETPFKIDENTKFLFDLRCKDCKRPLYTDSDLYS